MLLSLFRVEMDLMEVKGEFLDVDVDLILLYEDTCAVLGAGFT